ncbi:MAG: type IV secretory system conjugative DNA transfer family protein [Chloroflexi bacterium]|nr:type IV secretory system conjugative DNA transfer family protein [Chloroflexota bacterium]MCI0730343.1 type IV secretory system conjugative DNA transfer family protein [Chloroflexota bacterium]
MNEPMGNMTNSYYFSIWLKEMPAAARRRWLIAGGIFAAFWLAGALYAAFGVAGIAQLSGGLRLAASLSMGGFGILWSILKALGAIQETTQDPNLLWAPLALVLPGAVGVFFYLLSQPPNPLFDMRKKLEQFAHSQGRAEEKLIGQKLAVRRGVPFAWVGEDKQAVKVGLDETAGEGHVLVVGPTRSGKGLQLTDTLLTWRGPALVVDPKGEQLERTAYFRRQFGPVYRLPGHQVQLASYYHYLLDRDDVAELHSHLMRPWESRETIFAEKAMSLFTAAGLYAQAIGLEPVRLLLDLAESDPEEALTALEKVPAVRRHVRVFTNGAAPDSYREDKFVTSAFGNFTTRLMTYQKHLDTIAPPAGAGGRLVVDPEWVRQNGTIYLTYSLTDLQGVGGVVAAVLAAMLRYQIQRGLKERLLVAIDELPAVGLKNLTGYLATCGGYGITLLLYAQSISQLTGLYGPEETGAILSNCAHQLWYPAADYDTAEAMSKLYGLTLRASPVHSTSRGARQHRDPAGQASVQTNIHQGASWSWQERPALLPSQMMALPTDQVLVTTLSPGAQPALHYAGRKTKEPAGAGQRYVFLGRRLNPIALFDQLPGPASLGLPRPQYGERVYIPWTGVTAPPVNGVPPLPGQALSPADTSLSPAVEPAHDGPPAESAAPPAADPPPPAVDPAPDNPPAPGAPATAEPGPGSDPAGDEEPSGKDAF